MICTGEPFFNPRKKTRHKVAHARLFQERRKQKEKKGDPTWLPMNDRPHSERFWVFWVAVIDPLNEENEILRTPHKNEVWEMKNKMI